nr:protein SIEVE ELEMENT OCCLUSION B-like [Ipomoea batatas]
MVLMRAIDLSERMSSGIEIGDSIIPLLQKVLTERVSTVRDLVPGIDRKIDEFANKVDGIITDWLGEIEDQIQNPVDSNIYTTDWEKDLWMTETWCTKLVANLGNYRLSKWVDDNKCFFLVGGHDKQWVKTFESKVMVHIQLNPQSKVEMIYVGSNMKVASMIGDDGNDSNIVGHPALSWLFWARIRSMFMSRIKFLQETHCDEECDEILRRLEKLLAYEANDLVVNEWAMLCNGNKIVVCDVGDKMLKVMNEYDKWKENAIAKGFDQAFKDHHGMLDSAHTSKKYHSCAFEFPSNFDSVRENVKLCSLKEQSLLLLISPNLNIDIFMLAILKGVQEVTKVCIVWIPIFDYLELWAIKQMEELYGMLAKVFEWVSVINPHKSVASCFVRFVKEKWFPTFQIGGDPIIVSLDRHGRIVHHNAMYMIFMRALGIFQGIETGVEIGESIIPSLQNMLKERTLAVRSVMPDIDRKLDQIVGNMERVMIEGLDEIGKQIQNLAIDDENELCILIGGNNIKWVKTFLSSVLSQICFNPLQRFEVETIYVGSNMKVASMLDDEVKMFTKPNEFQNLLLSRIFWSRLQNLFLSRMKFLDETHGDEESDEIAKGLKLLLAYEGNGLGVDGWAMLCKGNEIVVCDLGEKMLTVVNEYEKWKESAIAKGFDNAFKDFHHMLGSTSTSQHHPCCTLEYPSNFDKTPKNVKCPQCCRNMQKLIAFRAIMFRKNSSVELSTLKQGILISPEEKREHQKGVDSRTEACLHELSSLQRYGGDHHCRPPCISEQTPPQSSHQATCLPPLHHYGGR